MAETKKIRRDMTIEHILSLFPNKAQRLTQEITNAGLHCVGCHAATWETLEAGMYGHGKTDAEIERLLERLNALLEEEQDETTITITPKAKEKFLSILKEEEKEGFSLRFGLKMGGCNGREYILDYSEKAHPENDDIFLSEGLEIHVDKKDTPNLIGSLIDYIDGLKGSGFNIMNPKAKSSCGCGKSQSF